MRFVNYINEAKKLKWYHSDYRGFSKITSIDRKKIEVNVNWPTHNRKDYEWFINVYDDKTKVVNKKVAGGTEKTKEEAMKKAEQALKLE